MTTRMVTWGTYAQKFDVENRLETVTVNGKTTRFFYDADGNRVLAVYKTNAVETSRTYTPFPDYEEEQPAGDTATRRVTFSANGQAVVQRRQKGDTVERFSLHTDHLGNVAAVANSAGVYVTNSYAVYEPFGAFNVQPTATNPSVTDRGFTGHRQNNTGAYDLKLIYMSARYYHPQLGRFISPDTIVPEPGIPQSYNRYGYAANNPIKYNDPSGHWFESVLDLASIAYDIYDIQQNGLNWTSGLSLAADVASLALPVVTGGGLAVRALAHADEVADVVTHVDEAVEVSRIAGNALQATQTTERFLSLGDEAIPNILKAFGDEGRVVGELPAAFRGRQTRVIGKLEDTRVAGEFGEHVFTTSETGRRMLELNADWISQGIERGDVFYLASQINSSKLISTDYGISGFGRELDALLQAGYQRVGDYLVPPH